MFPVKLAYWPGLARQAVLRWSIRRELRRHRAAHQRLRQAASQVLKHAEIRQALEPAPDAAAILQLIQHHEALRTPQTIHP